MIVTIAINGFELKKDQHNPADFKTCGVLFYKPVINSINVSLRDL
jgi:hypothetical protein